MTGDHHGRTARRATLLVTAADEILGTHKHPAAFAAPVIGLAIASAAGMGGGEAESEDRTDLVQRAVVMAVASVFGVIVVALPFFYPEGTAALVTSLMLALALGTWIAERRACDLGRGSAYLLTLTFGVHMKEVA